MRISSKGRRMPAWIAVSVFLAAATASRAYILEVQSNGATVPFWPKGTVTMQLQLDPTPLGTTLIDGSTSWGQSAEAALADWNTHLGTLQFLVVRNSTAPIAELNGYNNVFWSSTVYGESWGTLGAQVIAYTLYWWVGSQRTEADVIFNNNISFNSYRGNLVNGSDGKILDDFRRVALHEFGHVLCLNHPDQNGQNVVAIMNSVTSNTYDLTADDIAGAQVAYSAPAGNTAPSIAVQPKGASLAFRASDTLTVTPSGNGPFSYQWQLNGQSISGATSSSYSANAPGSYTVVVSNSAGATTSNPAVITAANRLINVSSRAQVGAGQNILIPGFVINGPPGTTKQVLIRASGPALVQFGVTGTLAQPSLSLTDSTGKVIASNTAWGTNSNAAQIAAVASQVGAFAFASGSSDCALLVNLAPGAYTFQVSGQNSTTGVALAELYEVDTGDPNLVINISTRIQVGTGANILIAGFVVQGSQAANLLIRGDGPGLSQFGVTGVLAQPVLTVFDSKGNVVATNAGWGTNANAAQIAAAASNDGAFALSNNSADSALLLTLQPGSYTAQVSGASGSTGVALVEVYQSP